MKVLIVWGMERLDRDYSKWRRQPKDCDIPRFNATKMLELIRGKRLCVLHLERSSLLHSSFSIQTFDVVVQEELQEVREKYVCDWILDVDNVWRDEVLQDLGLL
ncbi:hypothetical protein V8G54_020107 [Vigna mungo]|uniref:Uncharacterized protein n=1 Tax=Vigna mungo TaxID=3915 RepID=A0AAQ3NBZ3_VIGMU